LTNGQCLSQWKRSWCTFQLILVTWSFLGVCFHLGYAWISPPSLLSSLETAERESCLEPSSLLGLPLFRCCLEPPSFLSFTPQTAQRKHVNIITWSTGCDPILGEKKGKAMVMFYLLTARICKEKSRLVTCVAKC